MGRQGKTRGEHRKKRFPLVVKARGGPAHASRGMGERRSGKDEIRKIPSRGKQCSVGFLPRLGEPFSLGETGAGGRAHNRESLEKLAKI